MTSTKHILLRNIAIIFLAAIFFLSPIYQIKTSAETVEPPAEPPAQTPAKDYKYSVTITFGYMSFMYDWGTWDSNSFSYKANEASANPGAGTTKGEPGWYNFDGINNKISVTCTSTSVNTIRIPFTIKYDQKFLNEQTGTEDSVIKDGVIFECYEDAVEGAQIDWTMTKSDNSQIGLTKVAGNNNEYQTSVLVPYGSYQIKKDFYISFRGEPFNLDGTQFDATNITKVGYLTLTMGKPDVVATPIIPNN